ncbi:MAG: glycosyltransferase family 39 protein [Herpetosiphonaceae bacterium]|nr:glycosyltransferase family 39 protein [Herpetosiphonaceae bacterium]
MSSPVEESTSVLFFAPTFGRRILPILFPLLLFLLVASWHLDRPGLHYDEALEGGLPAVQLLQGLPVPTLNGFALHVGGRALPVMVQSHIGALQIYAALPFIWLSGSQVVALRSMSVVVGALTIIAVYLFMLQLYGRRAAFWASMWLALFGSFVFWSRQGVFVTSLAACLAMWALAAGAYWWQTGRLWAVALAGWLFGLAIWSKLNAGWLLAGVVGWWGICAMISLWQQRTRQAARIYRQGAGRRIGWSVLLVGTAGLIVGLAPVLLYNLRTGGATLEVVQQSAGETYLGADNRAVLHNLGERLVQAVDVVRSGDHLWYLGGTFPNTVAVLSLVGALAVLVSACFVRRGQGWQRLLFIPFLALAVILESCYTISALWPTHFAIAVALPAMIFGLGMQKTGDWIERYGIRWRRTARVALVALGLLVVLGQGVTDVRYLRAVTSSGGLSFHSASIYDLSHFLQTQHEHIVALDWGIAPPVEYLTDGQTAVEEVFNYHPELPTFGTQIRQRFNRKELYVTHADNQEAFKARSVFLKAVADSGHWAERVSTINGLRGNPELEVWRVRLPGQ